MFTKNWYKLMALNVFNTTTSFKKPDGSDKSHSGASNHALMAIGGSATSYNGNGYYAPQMCRVLKSLTSGLGGVVFGTGNTPPTIEDYTLSGSIITTFSASVAVTKSVDDDGGSITGIYTLVNTASDEITVSEVALLAPYYPGDGYMVMVERTVLDSPLVIPANGVGQITYTVKLVYPTE